MNVEKTPAAAPVQLAAALDSAAESMAWVGAAGLVLWSNAAFDRLARRPRGQVLGAPLSELLPLEPGPRDEDLLALASSGALELPRALSFRGPSGTVQLEVSGRRVEGAGHPGSVLLVLRDMTALAAANRELETFNYSISHDLRGPVNAIQCYSALLLQDPLRKLDVKERDSLKAVARMADRIMELIEGLLALSGVEHRAVSPSDIDMEALASEVYAELRAYADGRSISWKLEALPRALGDRVMVRQVMVNLLSNALKYTGRRAKTEISMGGRLEDGRALYFVKDNGAGFDPSRADKLFEPFQRLHTRHQFEGTGIGLTIVRRVVEKHGGSAWAEASPDQGAVFYFTLPAVPREP